MKLIAMLTLIETAPMHNVSPRHTARRPVAAVEAAMSAVSYLPSA